MTKEDKYKTEIELNKLLELLQKANEESLIDIYDYNENIYSIDWIFAAYNGKIMIKIKEI
jgi:hypothetical protein